MRASKYHDVVRSVKNAPRLAIAFLLCVVTGVATMSQTGGLSSISLPTEVHVQNPGWWPTKGEPSRQEYAGAEECTKCHAGKAATYRTTAMAHAAATAAGSEDLREHDRLSLQVGPFNYQILTSGEASVLSVADATSSLSRPLAWAFGEAHMGQTYVYEQNDSFYEGHLSFFTSLQALDITPGQAHSVPASLEDAAGRRMDLQEARKCFGCHTTASTTRNQFNPHDAIAGITCEGCHGPGMRHVSAMRLGTEDAPGNLIFNPRRLGPVDSVDFCGACHRTWQDVVKNQQVGLGVYNVRFGPYRLENSRCWGNGDARITCTACHDPHKRLVTEEASYDSACMQCHVARGAIQNADRRGASCPVATEKCVTCHMPKYEPPGLHSKFTDHWIRVIRSGKPYPS